MAEAKLLNDEQVREFITNGFIRLQADVALATHTAIDKQLRQTFADESRLGNNIVSRIPKMHEVLRSPIVHGALVSLAGPHYYLHPHRAIHRSTPIDDPTLEFADAVDAPQMGPGSTSGSGWHQDAQSPLARARHHLPRHLIGFYFPHDTPLKMGPTRLQAGSHLYANPVEPRAVVLPDRVSAGTFLVVHFDMVHAGFPNRTELDRYVVKFVFTRTAAPTAPTWQSEDAGWRRPNHCLVDYDLEGPWSHIWHWLRGSRIARAGNQTIGRNVDLTPHLANLGQADQVARLTSIYALAEQARSSSAGPVTIIALVDALQQTAGQQKHERKLVLDETGKPKPRDDIRGWPRCWNERAIVLEDAAYVLAASGDAAVPALIKLLGHNDPWVQINAAFSLGEIGPPAAASVEKLTNLLDSPYQQVVRQALDALGAIGCRLQLALGQIETLLGQSNSQWLHAQVGRGWNAQDQVRLNAAFTLLNATSLGEDLDAIECILVPALADANGYVAAVACEALIRIGTTTATTHAIGYLSDRRWDETLTGSKPF